MVTTRRKIGNFKSRILVSAEQARNETFPLKAFSSLALSSPFDTASYYYTFLVKCAKVGVCNIAGEDRMAVKENKLEKIPTFKNSK